MYFLLENMCFLRIVKISDVFFRKSGVLPPCFPSYFAIRFSTRFPSCFHASRMKFSDNIDGIRHDTAQSAWHGKENTKTICPFCRHSQSHH